MAEQTFSQDPYRCKLDWGREGARRAATRQDILVIVDVLSFSTAVATAIHRGAVIYPCSREDDPVTLAHSIGAEAAVDRRDVPSRGSYSLSPSTFDGAKPGDRIVLASPNGATCIRYGRDVPLLLVGALVNAAAVAAHAQRLLDEGDRCVTVIACGERQASGEGEGLRVAVEDYLGAGAILSSLSHSKSPEARVCAAAFAVTRDTLRETMWDCGSGRELRAMAFEADVERAAQLNVYDSVPILQDGSIRGYEPQRVSDVNVTTNL